MLLEEETFQDLPGTLAAITVSSYGTHCMAKEYFNAQNPVAGGNKFRNQAPKYGCREYIIINIQ